MKTKFLLRTVTACGLTAISHLIYGQKSDNPNIVIILADDMGYGDVSYNNPYARIATPNIDHMAENGLRFTDAHAGGAVSIPSRYGLVTGRYHFRVPKQPGYWGYLPPLIEKNRETIGTILQKGGYTTACIGKWHLGVDWELMESERPLVISKKPISYTNVDFHKEVKDSPNDHGFDYSFILPASLDMPPYVFLRNKQVIDPEVVLTADVYPHKKEDTVYEWDKKYVDDNEIYWERGVWWRNGEMSKSFKFEDCMDVIVDEGLSFIRNQHTENPDKPFMLYLPLTGPHTPWLPNEKFKSTTELGTYGDFIAQIDDVVFRVNDLLKQLKIDENTIVIFSSDNGSPWDDHDKLQLNHAANGHWRGQKGDIWEGGHHVPLFVQWPAKIKKGNDYPHITSLIDLVATFAELTGQNLEKGHAEDSFSFYNVLLGKQKKANRDHLLNISGTGKLAITQGNWKYTDYLGSEGFTYPAHVKEVPGGPKGQLYNLKNDPQEQQNLYLQYSGMVQDLLLRIQQIVEAGSSRY